MGAFFIPVHRKCGNTAFMGYGDSLSKANVQLLNGGKGSLHLAGYQNKSPNLTDKSSSKMGLNSWGRNMSSEFCITIGQLDWEKIDLIRALNQSNIWHYATIYSAITSFRLHLLLPMLFSPHNMLPILLMSNKCLYSAYH